MDLRETHTRWRLQPAHCGRAEPAAALYPPGTSHAGRRLTTALTSRWRQHQNVSVAQCAGNRADMSVSEATAARICCWGSQPAHIPCICIIIHATILYLPLAGTHVLRCSARPDNSTVLPCLHVSQGQKRHSLHQATKRHATHATQSTRAPASRPRPSPFIPSSSLHGAGVRRGAPQPCASARYHHVDPPAIHPPPLAHPPDASMLAP